MPVKRVAHDGVTTERALLFEKKLSFIAGLH
jgi:hypothetical protein